MPIRKPPPSPPAHSFPLELMKATTSHNFIFHNSSSGPGIFIPSPTFWRLSRNSRPYFLRQLFHPKKYRQEQPGNSQGVLNVAGTWRWFDCLSQLIQCFTWLDRGIFGVVERSECMCETPFEWVVPYYNNKIPLHHYMYHKRQIRVLSNRGLWITFGEIMNK